MTSSPAPRPPLDLDRLTAPAGWRVEVVESTPSTNAAVAERARTGEEPGLVLVTEHQTAGRGRLDRSWETPARSSLTFSVLLWSSFQRFYSVPSMEALQTATRNPPRSFGGRTEPGGVLAEGGLADLVLLDADPLVDIGNTRRIRAVVVNGRLLDRPALDAMLAPSPVKAAKE